MITYHRGDANLQAFGRLIPVWNNVRNEIDPNYVRNLHVASEVVHTTPDDGSNPVPYMPRKFPAGLWRITGIIAHSEPYLSPFFISTNSWQLVESWNIDQNGGYDSKTGNWVRDSAYGLHFSTSGTTLGCIRIVSQNDLLWLVEQLRPLLASDQIVNFLVSE